MTLRPGSFSWLLAHDMRLGWRGFTDIFGRMDIRLIGVIVVTIALLLHAVAWPLSIWLSPWIHGPLPSQAPLVAIVGCAFTWMLAQSLFGASRTLYNRGDLDLLLGSPLPARHVFAAKAAGLAAGTFGSIALLTLPLANAGAMAGTPAWLGLYPALLALALIATSLGLALSIGLFFWLGPVRARLWTQMIGALIAGTFVLGAQVAAVLPASIRNRVSGWLDAPWQADAPLAVAALRLPIEAVRGDAGAAGLLAVLAVSLFAAATALLGQRFANASLAAAGAPDGIRVKRNGQGQPKFRAGLARNMRLKEWRLLARDPGMFAQLALQVIYTLPVAVVLLRQEHLPSAFALAPTIVVVAAQIAGSLAWITVSGEDAPELIATAPVDGAAVNLAKLQAVALPVLAILALPLTALALVSWEDAMLTALIAGTAATSTALLNFWHPMPGNRRGMLRRHSQSKLVALIEHGMALLWAVAVVLALIGTQLALLPTLLVAAIMLAFRRRRTTSH